MKSIRLINRMAFAAGVLAWSGVASAASDIVLTRIVDQDTPLPGAIPSVQEIYSASISEGLIAFRARGGDWSQEGIWKHQNGQIDVVASTETLIPGTPIHFAGFGEPSTDGRRVVFFGAFPESCGYSSCGGIYVEEAGALTLLYSTNDTVPGTGYEFSGIMDTAIDESVVAFLGVWQDDQQYSHWGVFADFGAGLVTVADESTLNPIGPSTLRDFGELAVSDGKVYFAARDNLDWNLYAYYAYDPVAATLEAAAWPGMPIGQDTLGEVHQSNSREGTMAIIGCHNDPYCWEDRSLYVDSGSGLQRIASQAAPFIEGWTDTFEFGQLAPSAGMLAFTANDDLYIDKWLFLYRDGEFRPILQTGNDLDGDNLNEFYLDGEGSSDGEIVIRAGLRDEWTPTSVYRVSFNTPARSMVVAPDVNGNLSDEVVALNYDTAANGYRLQSRDSYSGAMTAMIDLGGFPVKDLATLENPGEPIAIAVLDTRETGRVRVRLYALAGGGWLRNILFYGTQMTPLGVAVLDDMNDNGSLELAVLAISPAQFVRVQIKDSVTGELLSDIATGRNLEPTAILALPDVTGNDMPEFAVRGVARDTGRVRVMVRDASTAATVSYLTFAPASVVTPHDAIVVPDVDAGGVPEIAMSGYRELDGEAVLIAKDAVSGATVIREVWETSDHPVAMTLVQGPPQTDPRLGLLMRAGTGDSAIEMRRADTGGLLARMDMVAITDATEIGGLADLDFDGEPEIGALGSHFGAQILEVHGCEDGEGLRFYFME